VTNQTEKLLLCKFLHQFLLASGNKRKYAHNEFSYFYNTIQKIFFRYGKIKISEEDLLACLSESGYSLYITSEKVGHNKKEITRKNSSKVKSFLNEELNVFIYIGISSKSVLQIRKASNSLVLQKNSLKIKELIPIQEKIIQFFNNNLPLK
jgi:hypothetical protein